VTGRRLLVLLVVLAAIAAPAGVLRALCVGRSCEEPEPRARVPFCTLPGELRRDIANGYREDRSADVLGVAGDVPVYTESGARGVRAPWPAIESSADTRVPIVLAGVGFEAATTVPDGTTLDRIAPSIAEAIGLDRPHPEVRSGTSIDGVLAREERPDLVLIVAWKWTGSRDLETSPEATAYLERLMRGGAGTLEGDAGSVPLDPTATLATIGTGGLPSQHGITGSFVRTDEGEVASAFGEGAPIPVIASLADDLDQSTGQRSEIGLVGTDELDRGLIGVGWAYENADEDEAVVVRGREAVDAARSFIADFPTDDGVTDLLGVVLEGGPPQLVRRTEAILKAAVSATDGSVLVAVAGTGTWEASMLAVSDAGLVAAVEDAVPGSSPAVAAMVPGGIFLDRQTLRAAEVTGQVAVDALLGVTGPGGRAIMADAFQGFAVSFARYC
jgi:hypothetical protein